MTCSICGCYGIHACIGHVPEQITEAGQKALAEMIERLQQMYAQEDLPPEFRVVSSDTDNSYNEQKD